MQQLATASSRVRQARGLAAVLDAAFEAFEQILAAIGEVEDASDGLVVPVLLAGTQAANGRDAVLFASSLPLHRLHPPAPAGQRPEQISPATITAAVAELSQLLACTLAGAADTTAGADRAACLDAAARARRIHDLLAGNAGGGP